MNGANAPPAPIDAPRPEPERELRVAFRLLLVSEGEHPAVPTGLDEVRRDDPGGAADRARGVHAEHGLARGAERVGEIELGLHHAFEQVGRLADDDGVDVGPRHLGVVERARRGLAHQPAQRHVPTPRLVLGLSDAHDRAGFVAHSGSPCRTHTRFCWRHGPDVAWASVRWLP